MMQETQNRLDLLFEAVGDADTVLMTPDLPKALFDICVIPEHDRPAPGNNIVVTRGSLNRMQALPVQERTVA